MITDLGYTCDKPLLYYSWKQLKTAGREDKNHDISGRKQKAAGNVCSSARCGRAGRDGLDGVSSLWYAGLRYPASVEDAGLRNRQNSAVALGGVAIRPGDVIVADGDGVIAVPRSAAKEVAMFASRELRNDKANRREKYLALGWKPDQTME